MKWEKNKNTATDFLLSFFIITACITIMEAVIGTIFMPGERFGFEAFFSPPLFGFLSALSSVVTFSRRQLSAGAMAVRLFLQLAMIEAMVLLINFFLGNWELFTAPMILTLILGIALIFCVVYLVMWLNERRISRLFNERLLEFQKEVQLQNEERLKNQEAWGGR